MAGVSTLHVNDKYGYLTLLEDTHERTGRGGQVIWKCQCDCGNIVHRSSDSIMQSLIKGCVISCGCKKDKTIGQRFKNDPVRIQKAREAIGPFEGTTMQGIGDQKLRKNNTSGIRGVAYDSKRNIWRARLMFKRKEYFGEFKTKEEAIKYRKYLEDVYFEPAKEQYKMKEGE